MSVVRVAALHDLAGHDAYVSEGRGEQRRDNLADSTDRLAPGSRADLSREEFVALGQQLAREHGRRVEALGIVVAWSPDELSTNSTDDLQLAGDHAYALAKRLHPRSPVSVVVHADSAGQHVHAHVAVLNHNFETGRALTTGRRHREVAAVNDELSREQGMRVIEPQPRTAAHAASPFDDLLRQRIVDALAHPETCDWETFVATCAARGVEVVATSHEIMSDARGGKRRGDTSTGVTYKALDTAGPKRRVRRRKASALGVEFTYDAILAALAMKGMQAGREAERESSATSRARPARERSELLDTMQGVLLRGGYAALPGYVGLALKVGVAVTRSSQRLAAQRAIEADLVRQHVEAIEAEAARRRPRSASRSRLPPAAQRHAEMDRAVRQRRDRGLGE